MTRVVSYLASFFMIIDFTILFLAVSYGITWQMVVSFPAITFVAWRLTRISNNRKTVAICRRGYHDQVVAFGALQDEQGADQVRALWPMVRELGCPRQASQYRVEQGYTES